jgi:hypothetical protein
MDLTEIRFVVSKTLVNIYQFTRCHILEEIDHQDISDRIPDHEFYKFRLKRSLVTLAFFR